MTSGGGRVSTGDMASTAEGGHVRPIVLAMSVSIDGFFEGPGEDISWHRVDDELHSHFNEEHRAASLYLEGRRTRQLMADFWPTADQDPTNPPVMHEYAHIWRDTPSIVWSRTLTEDPGWGSQLRREVDPDEIRALKQADGGPIYLGGAVLAESFLAHGLVDEVRWYVHPVALGQGRRVFGPDHAPDLRLIDTRTFGNGVVLLHYAVEAATVG